MNQRVVTSPIRVLVVDDSVVIRRRLSEVLRRDPGLKVVGTAPNGRIALAKIRQLNPDLVTLDVEMPDMDGVDAMKEIRKLDPGLPVLMFSSLTGRGASVTLDALSAGARDYVTKPSSLGQTGVAADYVRDELIRKIKVLCPTAIGGKKANVTGPIKSSEHGIKKRLDIVAIGVSTGGPVALQTIIPSLPEDFPVGVVIAQHMPPVFTKTLAERLSKLSRVPVYEGAPGDIVRPGAVWLAPGNYHMFLSRRITASQIQTDQSPRRNSCRPSADVLFRSVADLYGPRSLAIVLTGMGDDGLRGCEDIRRAGGQVIVQDEESSVVWGMPGRVAEAGLADAVLPLKEIACEVVRRVRTGRI